MSFPAFSGLVAILIAAAAAPPDDIPTCNTCSHRYLRRSKIQTRRHRTTNLFNQNFGNRQSSKKLLRKKNTLLKHIFHCYGLTSKPSFNASSLAVSIASSLDTYNDTMLIRDVNEERQ